MKFAHLPTRHSLPLLLLTAAISACQCDRETFDPFPDAGPPPDAGQPDAGPPPAEFPLKPGDKLKYPVPVQVTHCAGGSTGNCVTGSVWTSEYTIQEPGASLEASTNAYLVPALYFWQVASRDDTDMTNFNAMSKLWLSNFGPWDQAQNASGSETLTYRTDKAFLPDGLPDSFPFLEYPARFDQAAEALRAHVLALDANALVETQEASRKMEVGFLEPTDPTLLHFVQVIYHRLGMVCLVNESIGPWDPTKPKNDSGFAGNQRDFKGTVNGVTLTRAAGAKAGMPQTCKCSNAPFGNDCE